MSFNRFPTRDPRTIARDIPGLLDVLFPRLTGGLVRSLNSAAFSFEGFSPLPEKILSSSRLQNAMIFELSTVRAEGNMRGEEISWEDCLKIAAKRQCHYFDARVPEQLEPDDILAADHAARNLTSMLSSVLKQRLKATLDFAPEIPGLGWVASGNGDFAIGSTLIEVKHTERNFGASELRQVLMYWLLRFANLIEGRDEVWSDVLLLNPRRNAALLINYDYLLRSASASSSRIELLELLRFVVGQEADRR